MLRILLRLLCLAVGGSYVLSIYWRGEASPLTYWITLSFGLVVAMRLGVTKSFFGKQASGKVAWWAYLLLGPFLLFRWLLWHTLRWFSTEIPFAEYGPGVFVGRRLYADEMPERIDLVVDLTYEFAEPEGIVDSRGYRLFPILEGSVPIGASDFMGLISDLKNEERAIYIHCADGHGRTAMVAVALAIARGLAADVKSAFDEFRKARGAGFLTFRQKHFLIKLEPQLVAMAESSLASEA